MLSNEQQGKPQGIKIKNTDQVYAIESTLSFYLNIFFIIMLLFVLS